MHAVWNMDITQTDIMGIPYLMAIRRQELYCYELGIFNLHSIDTANKVWQ
jgi:hypothetical protein